MKRSGFTLIEILVVIAIIAVLAAILFPVFARAKSAAKRASCVAQVRQIGAALMLYLQDSDGKYPQVRRTSAHPESDDASGGWEEPSYGAVFAKLYAYTGHGSITPDHLNGQRLYACAEDPDPFGQQCAAFNPDAPPEVSYLMNGLFAFGLLESEVDRPAGTIVIAERRSGAAGDAPPYCDDLYRPWWNPANASAPEDEMDPVVGAIATTRHLDQANYVFVDGHVKGLPFRATFSPPEVDLHAVR